MSTGIKFPVPTDEHVPVKRPQFRPYFGNCSILTETIIRIQGPIARFSLKIKLAAITLSPSAQIYTCCSKFASPSAAFFNSAVDANFRHCAFCSSVELGRPNTKSGSRLLARPCTSVQYFSISATSVAFAFVVDLWVADCLAVFPEIGHERNTKKKAEKNIIERTLRSSLAWNVHLIRRGI